MYRRLLAFALILIVAGLLPRALAFLKMPIRWPEQLSSFSFLPDPVRPWIVAYGSFDIVAVIGAVLFVIAAILSTRRLWGEYSQTGPIRASDVLLQEARQVHDGAEPDEVLLIAINNYHRALQEQSARRESEGAARRWEQEDVSAVSPKVYRWLNGLNRTALCLSGGGIRSASFGLGVLQALAMHSRTTSSPIKKPEDSLLSEFQYLSTVSGGGYIGAWLSSWLHQVSYTKAWRDLVRHPEREQDPGEQAGPIRWLRAHGNYLTPQLGLSGDTLADVAIYLRNLVLNWLVLLPVLCAALIVMKLIALQVFYVWNLSDSSGTKYGVPLLIWVFFLVWALSFALRNRPSRTHDDRKQADESAYLKWGLLPSILAAISFTLFLALAVLYVTKHTGACPSDAKPTTNPDCRLQAVKQLEWSAFVLAGIGGALIYAASFAISWVISLPKLGMRTGKQVWAIIKRDDTERSTKPAPGNFWRWTLSGAIYGTLVMTITYFFLNFDHVIERIIFFQSAFQVEPTPTPEAGPRHLLALIYLGVPLMLIAQLSAEMIFVGLTSGEENSEEDREWLGRGAGLAFLAGLGWLLIMHLAYVGSDLTYWLFKVFLSNPRTSLAVIAVLYVVGAIAAAIGRSSRTRAQRGPQLGAKAKSANATLSIIAAILGVTLVIGVSALLDWIVLGRAIAERFPEPTATGWMPAEGVSFLVALLIVLFIAVISSGSININRFSMHALYRNRLIRTFLGASNQDRRPNPFTNFARDDNPDMHTLWPCRHDWSGGKIPDHPSGEVKRGWIPFHVVNIALNVTSSRERLEWQERKAASFTVSPLHSGSAITGYRSSKDYGAGISLGTAIAVSGAAASPNQGYNSSLPVAFLMALFNVRLGWWLGNPGKSGDKTHKYDGPKNAVIPFLAEMLGMTSDTNKYVYLSDGGHFENLGLYEMVRRRCRDIVVVDAGCDPHYAFEDLGNAVRKIEIDFGIPIRFHGLDKLRPRIPPQFLDEFVGGPVAVHGKGEDAGPPPYHAIGVIDYAVADGPGEQVGTILYIKPGFHGTEKSAGILSYASSNPNFPHDDTANQWFGEAQMESYRALGFEITDSLLRTAFTELPETPEPLLPRVLKVLKQSAEARIVSNA